MASFPALLYSLRSKFSSHIIRFLPLWDSGAWGITVVEIYNCKLHMFTSEALFKYTFSSSTSIIGLCSWSIEGECIKRCYWSLFDLEYYSGLFMSSCSWSIILGWILADAGWLLLWWVTLHGMFFGETGCKLHRRVVKNNDVPNRNKRRHSKYQSAANRQLERKATITSFP